MAHDPAPILSVCMPTYNRAALLEDALESLRSQIVELGPEVELVVSDNCSTDDTPQVLRRAGDWVRWSRSERTHGITANIMRVTCDVARGRFVWLIGDDDLVLPGAVRRVLESLKAHPDRDYHYLNFGWLPVDHRHRIIREMNSDPVLFPAPPGTFQCDEFRTLLLPRIEDLAFLPGTNPSAIFSGIFCFAARRDFFLDARDSLHPSDVLDGSTTLMDDIFAHALVTVPPMAGRPIVYVGRPCLLQGTGGWEWGSYVNKMMIFGTYQLFTWLQTTPFAADAMTALWRSYHTMAGWLLFQMLHWPEHHKGLDTVLHEAIPAAAAEMQFWDAFLSECRKTVAPSDDAGFDPLAVWVAGVLERQPDARVGLWGVSPRGAAAAASTPVKGNLVWAADRAADVQGTRLAGTDLSITDPGTLAAADLDILILGARTESLPAMLPTAMSRMKPGSVIVCVDGLAPV